MSFRHKIKGNINTLLGSIREQDREVFLGGPENLEGVVVDKGENVNLSWEPPLGDAEVYGYELFVDGSYHATITNGLTYKYEGLTFQVFSNFKVRAIGLFNFKSSFSNIISFQGGGLPVLRPIVYENEFKAGSASWQDISNNQYYNIEGYNVYGNIGGTLVSGDKLNTSLLSLEILSYTYFLAAFDQDFNIGVSFQYDGGLESDIFKAVGSTLSNTNLVTYIFSAFGEGSRNFVGGPEAGLKLRNGEKFGVRVKDNTEVSVQVMFNPYDKIYSRQWATRDKEDWIWLLRGLHDRASVINWRSGCAINEGFREVVENSNMSGSAILSGIKAIGFSCFRGIWYKETQTYSSFDGFVFIGPPCPGIGRDTTFSAKFTLNNINVLEENLESETGLRIIRKPSGREERLTVSIANNKPVFNWYTYGGVFKYELYIKTSTGTYSSTPDHTESSGGAVGRHIVEGLLPNNYNAKVIYKLKDSSTYVTESNEVSFTVS